MVAAGGRGAAERLCAAGIWASGIQEYVVYGVCMGRAVQLDGMGVYRYGVGADDGGFLAMSESWVADKDFPQYENLEMMNQRQV